MTDQERKELEQIFAEMMSSKATLAKPAKNRKPKE